MKRMLLAAGFAAATLGAATAAADDDPHAVFAIAAMGWSRALDRPVVNVGPPAIELRYGRRLSAFLAPDVGLALIAFPEAIPALRPGVQVRPFGASSSGIARALFVRPEAHVLLATGAGFEWGLGAEAGCLVEGRRVLAQLSVSSTRMFRHPRLLVEPRAGVGVRF